MKNIYSLYDAAAMMHLDPFMFPHDAQAIRAFEALVLTKGSDPAMFPQDFALYKIGFYDPLHGHLTALSPERIISAIEILHNNKKLKADQEELFTDEDPLDDHLFPTGE